MNLSINMKSLCILFAYATTLATSQAKESNLDKKAVDKTTQEATNNIRRRKLDGLPEGTSIQCTNESTTGNVYRWEFGELHHYPNGMIANSWNPNWRDVSFADCTDLQVGSPMSMGDILEGYGVRCTEMDDGKVYRWTNNELHHYPSGEIARSWNPNWRGDILDLNCEHKSVGTVMSLNDNLRDYGPSAHYYHSALQLCEGDCDNDSQCADGLVCFQRDGFTKVPGCTGTGMENYDYCIDQSNVGKCLDTPNWYDIDGPYYSCEWYASGATYCEEMGHMYANFGQTANGACCVCGGGSSFS
jgi:hypothetical protein